MSLHLTGFADFVEATGPTYVTGPQSLINDAQEQTYSFGDLTYGDTGKKKMIQGGSDIRESIIFEDRGTFQFHHPGETRNWVNPQKLQKIKAFWRFSEDHMAWTRQEVLLNDQIKYGTADARFHAYVNLRNEKEMLMWTSVWNGMEEQLWTAPIPADMEAEAGKQPFSIPAFVNEDTNGLFDPQASAAFTTIEGIDPTASGFTKFVPVQNTYASIASTDVNTNIFAAFDDTWKDVRYEMPPSMTEYFTNPKFSKFRIFCSREGQSRYQQLLRAAQDQFVTPSRQDPAYASPLYNGIPVTWVSRLDSAALYDSGSSTLATESAADITGPRYYWINSDFLYPVFHDEMYFEKSAPHMHHNDPDTYVCEVNTWYQVICTSRQRQAIVSPSVDV